MNNTSNRLLLYLVGIASLFLILFGIRGTASILNPILLAGVITITVLPIPGKLTRRGMPGWLALVLTILVVVVLLALVILTVFFSLTRLSSELPVYTTGLSDHVEREMPSAIIDEISRMTFEVGPVVQGFFAALFDILVAFGIALVIFFFMISAAISLPTPSRLGLDPNNPMFSRLTEITGGIRKYMTVLTGVNFLVGLGDTLLLWVVGVDYAVLWGLLAWFMGYIPSVGFIIALIPPVLMAYAEFGFTAALVVFLGYVLINGGVQNFIQPKIMGQNLKISPAVVFIGLFVWGFLLGGIGAILAVPMTLLVLTAMENFEGTKMLAVLMRYTGEEKKKERKDALDQLKGHWEKATNTEESDDPK